MGVPVGQGGLSTPVSADFGVCLQKPAISSGREVVYSSEYAAYFTLGSRPICRHTNRYIL